MNTLIHFLKYELGLVQAETSVTKAEWDCMASHASGRRCLVEIGVWHGVTTSPSTRGDGIGRDPVRGRPVPGRAARDQSATTASPTPKSAGCPTAAWSGSERLGPTRPGSWRQKWPAGLSSCSSTGTISYDGLRADWEGWSRLVAPGGLIALHDSRSSPVRPIERRRERSLHQRSHSRRLPIRGRGHDRFTDCSPETSRVTQGDRVQHRPSRIRRVAQPA